MEQSNTRPDRNNKNLFILPPCKLLTVIKSLENIKKKNEMLEQREKLIKQVDELETQIDIIEESYKKFMDENFKDDSAYYIPDNFKQQVIVISKNIISDGYKMRL